MHDQDNATFTVRDKPHMQIENKQILKYSCSKLNLRRILSHMI